MWGHHSSRRGKKKTPIQDGLLKYVLPATVSAGVFFWLMPKSLKTPVTIEQKADTAPPPLVELATSPGGPRAQSYLSQIDSALHNLMAAQHSVAGGAPTSILDTAITNSTGTAAVVKEMAQKDLDQGGITSDDLVQINGQADRLLAQSKG